MDLRGRAGHEHVLAAGGDPLDDGRDLLRRLAGPEDGLREAAAERPVVVDLGEAEVLVGQASAGAPRPPRRGLTSSVANGLQERFEVRIH